MASKARSRSSTWPPPMRIASSGVPAARRQLERAGEGEVHLGGAAAGAEAAELLLDRDRQRAGRDEREHRLLRVGGGEDDRGVDRLARGERDAGDRAAVRQPDPRDVGIRPELCPGSLRRGDQRGDERRRTTGEGLAAGALAQQQIGVAAGRPGAAPGGGDGRSRQRFDQERRLELLVQEVGDAHRGDARQLDHLLALELQRHEAAAREAEDFAPAVAASAAADRRRGSSRTPVGSGSERTGKGCSCRRRGAIALRSRRRSRRCRQTAECRGRPARRCRSRAPDGTCRPCFSRSSCAARPSSSSGRRRGGCRGRE